MYRSGCKQFKYFQDSIKKDVGDGDDVVGECHKVKVYSLDLLSKSADTAELLKPPEMKAEKPAAVEEVKTYETHSFSGYFRNGNRRIDLMLVFAEETNSEVKKIQSDFLSSIVKTGLLVEIEPGLMRSHRSLTFVKIHAPDSVLEEYGEKLGVKKYFKDIHVKYIQTKIPEYFEKREKDWVYLVRSNYEKPLNYSNSDRSLLVYKLLLNLRFGEHQNNFGLKRLLNWNIARDVFALHDGPYFLTSKQDFSAVNARQILYYNWIGWLDMFTLQPLNLIQEYFGSRVGFYFAFLQFYNLGLAVACLVGIAMAAFAFQDKTYETVIADTCQSKNMICPRCFYFDICPFLDLKNYCFAAKVTNFVDHYLLPVHFMFLVFWGSAFVILWSRKEKYWLWMWELYNVKNAITTRPEFTMNYNNPVQSDSTGLWIYRNSGIPKLIRYVVTLAFYISCIYFGLLIFYRLIFLKYNHMMYYIKSDNLPKQFEKYIEIVYFVTLDVIVFTIYEKICYLIAIFVNRFENHRSVESYDRALSLKLFVITCTGTYPVLIYYTWYKTRLYYIPGRSKGMGYYNLDLDFIADGMQRNCGPFPCMDEVSTAVTISVLLRQIIPKIMFYIGRAFWPRRTDYNQGKSINKKYPCWEREYRLKTVTEEKITAYYNYLALQFGYILMFGITTPLLPVVVWILNLIDIRFTAREILLSSRRPLLLEKSGLDIWSKLFLIIPLASILTNALLLSMDSRNSYRYLYLKQSDNMTGFLDFTLSKFYTGDYKKLPTRDYFLKYKGKIPDICYFPGLETTLNEFDKLVSGDVEFYYISPQYVPLPEYLEVKKIKYQIIMACHYVGLLIFLLVQFIIPPSPQDIEDSVQAEQQIKEVFLTHSGQ